MIPIHAPYLRRLPKPVISVLSPPYILAKKLSSRLSASLSTSGVGFLVKELAFRSTHVSAADKQDITNPLTPDEILVFMPTFAPGKEVPRGFRGIDGPVPYKDIVKRGWIRRFGVPWTYLDAIDSIYHTLGRGVHLVVADFASSKEIQDVLLHHQKSLGLPNYELWLGDKADLQWRAFNAVLLAKLRSGSYKYVAYTQSDVLFTQKDWLVHCILEFDKDPNCYICYPTVTHSTENHAHAQVSPRPRQEDAYPISYSNLYVSIFRREFFEAFNHKYPDMIQSWTEGLIPYMLGALGKTQKVVPRANCSHCERMDVWKVDGYSYNWIADQPIWEDLVAQVQSYIRQRIPDWEPTPPAPFARKVDATIELGTQALRQHPLNSRDIPFLKGLFYRDNSYYDGFEYRKFKAGVEF